MKIFHALALLLTLLPAPASHAAIYVSDLEIARVGKVLTFRYLLNEDAVSGSLTVAKAATPDVPVLTVPLPAADRTRGAHTLTTTTDNFLTGDYVFSIQVAAAPRAQYGLITPVSALPAGATVGFGAPVSHARGVPGYGHVFLADPAAHRVYEYNAAGALVQSLEVNPSGSGSLVPFAVSVSHDGRLYASDQDTDTILEFTPTGSAAVPAWTKTTTYTGQRDSVDPSLGSLRTRGFHIAGSGPSGRVYLTDYLSPSGINLATLGDTSQAPRRLFSTAALAGGRADQVLAAPDEKAVYVSSGAAPLEEGPRLQRYVLSGSAWGLDPAFAENARPTIAGRVRGLAFGRDGALLAAVNGGTGSGVDENAIVRLSTSATTGQPPTGSAALRIAGGLTRPMAGQAAAVDANGDGRVTIADALIRLRKPLAAGVELERIPSPLYGSPALPLLPVTLGADPAGNIVVVAAPNTASGLTGSLFYTIAPPDNGSQDTAQGPAFRL